MVRERDDGAGISAVTLQTLDQLVRVGVVATQVDEGDAKAAVGERLQRLLCGRDDEALIPAGLQGAEESHLGCGVDFDHECSSLNRFATIARQLTAKAIPKRYTTVDCVSAD